MVSSKETNTNLRRKLGRIKSKLTTKMNHAFEDAQKAANLYLANIKLIEDEAWKKAQEIITQAWNFLLEKSKNELRPSGKPYFIHPMRVASILAENHLDYESIIAGFFHNILEVPEIDENEISEKFGTAVLTIIQGSKKITNFPKIFQ